MSETFASGREFARTLDDADPLRALRGEYHLPEGPDGAPATYFCGNSLGLQPKKTREYVERELDDWARLAVHGHFDGRHPWYRYHEAFRGPLARLVGAREHEVVAMNSLTVNLHLLFVSCYRPTRERYKIVIEDPVFPSDQYAVQTQIRHHGLDPEDALVRVRPREGEQTLRMDDIEATLEREGESVALVFFGGVNFLTGQFFDLARLARAAKTVGARFGVDLAHGAGNVPLALHDWGVDFAMWCSYKYLNGGPGAMAGAFIHEDLAADRTVPRFGGWWGNDPETRFRMQLEPEFVPVPSADGWQLSNPSVFALAPLRASLELFDGTGMDALRTKSLRLTGYLEYLLREYATDTTEIITPGDPETRGCQLSLRLRDDARAVQRNLDARGFVCDFREPDILRVAPTPSYNTFDEVWRFVEVLRGNAG